MKLKIYLTSCSGDFYPELCMVRCWNVLISDLPDVAVIEMALNGTYSAPHRMVSRGPSVCTGIIT